MRRAYARRLLALARTIAASVVCLSAVPSHAAQDAWERVRNMAAGTQVVITTTSGTTVEGKLESTTGELVLAVESDGRRRFATTDILTLGTVKRDSVWTGVLAGAALGFAAGSGVGAAWYYGSGRYGAKPSGYATQFITGIGVLGRIAGAVVGWRVDAAHARVQVIYDARLSHGRYESANAAGMPHVSASTETSDSDQRIPDYLLTDLAHASQARACGLLAGRAGLTQISHDCRPSS